MNTAGTCRFFLTETSENDEALRELSLYIVSWIVQLWTKVLITFSWLAESQDRTFLFWLMAGRVNVWCTFSTLEVDVWASPCVGICSPAFLTNVLRNAASVKCCSYMWSRLLMEPVLSIEGDVLIDSPCQCLSRLQADNKGRAIARCGWYKWIRWIGCYLWI